jgi:hypothetical protein
MAFPIRQLNPQCLDYLEKEKGELEMQCGLNKEERDAYERGRGLPNNLKTGLCCLHRRLIRNRNERLGRTPHFCSPETCGRPDNRPFQPIE